MLISAVLPIMSIYRLPQGQYGYSGHVVNLPQDISSFATSLPRDPQDLDVIIVRREGSDHTHRDFRVRRSVVMRALQWLVANNRYYRDITINTVVMDQLPEDGDLSGLCTITMDNTQEEEDSTPGEEGYPLSTSFIPSAARRTTEREAVRQVVQGSSQSPQVLSWPSTGAPVNEFTTEGYMSRAFPTLYPTGSADFLAPRIHSVTVGNYFRCMKAGGLPPTLASATLP